MDGYLLLAENMVPALGRDLLSPCKRIRQNAGAVQMCGKRTWHKLGRVWIGSLPGLTRS